MICIPISGKAQHGKDTLANYLKKRLESAGRKVLIIHYADYIKMLAEKIYSWDGNKDEKGRELLQLLGDKIRKADPNFIIQQLINILYIFQNDFDFAIIPDARFEKEVLSLSEIWSTIAVKVERNNFENNLTETQKNHSSEKAMSTFRFDEVFKFEENWFEKTNDDVEKFIDKLNTLGG